MSTAKSAMQIAETLMERGCPHTLKLDKEIGYEGYPQPKWECVNCVADLLQADRRRLAEAVREVAALAVCDGLVPEQQLVVDSIRRAIRALDIDKLLAEMEKP